MRPEDDDGLAWLRPGVPTGPDQLPPGLSLDLACVVARLDQLDREGTDSCGGLIFERLFTCDLPRLRAWSVRNPARTNPA